MWVWVLAIVVLLSGCESSDPPLSLLDVVPNVAPAEHETVLSLRGTYYVPIRGDLRSGQQLVNDQFEVELGGELLDEVFLVSETELTATVPMHFTVGLHDIVVRDPLGREAELSRALLVFPRDEWRPVVEITSHEDGERVRPGESINVSFSVQDQPPGRIRAYEWTLSGAASDRGSRELTQPTSEYFGTVPITAPIEPVIRELVVLILVEDDAAEPNYGSARVTLLVDMCSRDRDCMDHLFCNGQERCIEGECVDGTEVACDDGIRCTDDECDETTRRCSYQANDSLCDNGLYCDGQEICDSIYGCLEGIEPCDDGIECTIEECIEGPTVGEPGECLVTPDDASCDDGVFCNGVERCEPDHGCVDGPDPCLDSFECTINTCYEDERYCEVVVDHLLCQDGFDCTLDYCDKDRGCINMPGREGPAGDASCSDGADNDCDELIDAEDPDCI